MGEGAGYVAQSEGQGPGCIAVPCACQGSAKCLQDTAAQPAAWLGPAEPVSGDRCARVLHARAGRASVKEEHGRSRSHPTAGLTATAGLMPHSRSHGTAELMPHSLSHPTAGGTVPGGVLCCSSFARTWTPLGRLSLGRTHAMPAAFLEAYPGPPVGSGAGYPHPICASTKAPCMLCPQAPPHLGLALRLIPVHPLE